MLAIRSVLDMAIEEERAAVAREGLIMNESPPPPPTPFESGLHPRFELDKAKAK